MSSSGKRLTRVVGSVAAHALAGDASSSAAAAAPVARILCFGDSLTEGYVARGTIMHPYGRSLLSSLGSLAGAPYACVVEESGLSGELSSAMVARLAAVLAHAKDQARPYDWVILLGGTNDLCHNVPTEQIIRQLHTMHR